MEFLIAYIFTDSINVKISGNPSTHPVFCYRRQV